MPVVMPLRIGALLLVLLSLAACQTLRPPPQPPAPLASERFIIETPDQTVVGRVQTVIAGPGDTLPTLARRFNLGADEMTAANPGVTDATLRGRRIVLPTQFILPDAPREGIVINLATLRLFYFPPAPPGAPREVITYPIGIGREDWPTPIGKTRIVKKVEGPTWYVPASIRREHASWGDPLPAQVPPGPNNPLGTHALRLAWPRYLIHGTNKPQGIGMRVSHGCMQLYPENIISLYQATSVGTPVYIVNQPLLAGWHESMLYLDAHPPLEEDRRNWRKRVRALLKKKAAQPPAGAQAAPVDWDKVDRLLDHPRGVPAPVLVGAPSLEQTLADAITVDPRFALKAGGARSPD